MVKRRLFLASLLLADSLHNANEAGYRAHHAAHESSDKDFLARQVCQSLYAGRVKIRTVANAALECELLGLLAEFNRDLRGCT